MKYITASLPSELEYVDLYSVSDVHRGHKNHDRKAWHTLLKIMRDDPHAYMVLNGDLTEMALKSGRFGDTYRTMPPRDERRTLERELAPVAHKILGATSGNHDMRPEKDADENPVQLIMQHLGIEDKYDPLALVLKVSFGTRNGDADRKTAFSFYVTHGQGQGRFPGGKMNRIQEMSYIIEGVDGYLMGHVHELMSRIVYRHVADHQNEMILDRPIAYVIGGSFLTYGDYVEMNMLTPNAVAMPILRLYRKRRHDETKRMQIIMPTDIRPQ